MLDPGGFQRLIVSVIVPAYNRAETIRETLDSLLVQTEPGWEAIVVDDGSTDDTFAVAQAYAARDPRFRVVQQVNAGVSAARNHGVMLAAAPWTFFLDADDWIHPAAFERLLAPLAGSPEADLIHGRCIHVLVDGTQVPEEEPPTADELFLTFAQRCAFSPHTCIVRTALVREVGGFDESLITCEDWDLWQRIARTRPRFERTVSDVAYYRIRPSSASRQADQFFKDGVAVISRGYRADERLRDWPGELARPVRLELLSAALAYHTGYAAGLRIAGGHDARDLLAVLPDAIGGVNGDMLANSLFQGMIGRLAKLPTAWPPVPVEVAVRLEAFIRAMAEKVAEDALVDATTERIEALILANSGDDAGASTMGGTRLLRCDLDEPWIDSTNGSSTRRLLIEYQADGERLGSAVLPAIDGALPAVVIADALVAEFSWELLRRFFGRTVYQEIDTERRGDATIFSRAGAPVVHLNGEVNVDGIDALHAAIGWPVFLQELWDCRGWPVERFYKRPSRRLRRPEPSRWEIRDDGSSIAVEIALDLPRILTSFRDVDIDVTLGGIPVLSLRVGAARGAVWPDQLRRIIMDAGRFEICRLAVREALVLGDWPDRVPLRDRLAQLAQRRGYVPRAHNRAPELWDSLIREMSAPGLGAILVGRRPGANVHGTGNRTRLIPRESINVVVEAARAGGQEVVNTGGSQPSALALRAPFMFQSGEQLVPAESDDGLLARFRRRSGPPREQADDRRYSDRLPILMYHRIAESASTTTRRWVTTPAEFEQQLAFLSEHEYGPIDIEEWADAISLNVGVRGKRVLITFDDGDEDFATSAVPLLERYGLCAELFVPCDHVGGTNAWSAGSGERIHLMGWDTLRQMPPHVVKVGSHGASHRPLAALALADAMDELVRSRAALEDELGREVISLAYPSGSADGAVAYLAGAAGYEFAYTTEPWRAYPDSDRLRLPRLEVRGGQTIEEFAQMLSGF